MGGQGGERKRGRAGPTAKPPWPAAAALGEAGDAWKQRHGSPYPRRFRLPERAKKSPTPPPPSQQAAAAAASAIADASHNSVPRGAAWRSAVARLPSPVPPHHNPKTATPPHKQPQRRRHERRRPPIPSQPPSTLIRGSPMRTRKNSPREQVSRWGEGAFLGVSNRGGGDVAEAPAVGAHRWQRHAMAPCKGPRRSGA